MANKATSGNGYSDVGGFTAANCLQTGGKVNARRWIDMVMRGVIRPPRPFVQDSAPVNPRARRDAANRWDAATGFTPGACGRTDGGKS